MQGSPTAMPPSYPNSPSNFSEPDRFGAVWGLGFWRVGIYIGAVVKGCSNGRKRYMVMLRILEKPKACVVKSLLSTLTSCT